MEDAALIHDTDAVDALCEMARLRGLHAARTEAEQTWRVVQGQTVAERLIASWSWLFAGHSVDRVPLRLLRNAQLPAWVIQGSSVGLLRSLDDEGRPLQIDWLTTAPEGSVPPPDALVPVPPGLGGHESFVDPKKRGIATEAILAAVSDHRGLFYRVGWLSLLINLLSVVGALFTMQVYDRVVPNFAYATLWVLASGLLLAYLFELAFKLVRTHLLEASAQRLDEGLSLYFFERLLSLKIDRRPSRIGTLVAQIRDYESIKAFFTSSTLFAIADLPFILMFIGIVALIGGPVAWVLLFFVPLSVAAGLAVYKPTARLQAQENDEAARRTGVLFEAVAGAEGIKAQGGEPRFSDVWLRATREASGVGVQLRKLNAYAQFAAALLQNLSYAGVIIVGVYVIEGGHLTMGGLIACSILSGRVLSSTSQITRLLLQWHHARHSLQILNKVLGSPTDEDASRQANTHSAPLDLAVKGLSYAYEAGGSPQLQIAELKIPAGQRAAVMGRNGSGKSTLLRLLAGIATPSAGEVTIANLDMQRCRPGWLRDVIGYLPQEVKLFSGTLAENLTLGMSRPDEASIRAAMEKTGLLRTLGRHPQGLNLPIREGGSGLSGGQRQMVGLTRLVLQNPKIWLLDEPSASLDQESEERLLTILRELPRDRTVIFTSHRNGWLAIADRMILMEDGTIKADAPAEQVRNNLQAARAAALAAGKGKPSAVNL